MVNETEGTKAPAGDAFPDVVVLAGGLGTRLRSVIADRPKVLAPVYGRPFVSHVLDLVQAVGARRVVLAVGYLAQAIEDAIGTRHGRLEIRYAFEDEPLGTGGALTNSVAQVETDDVLVLNGDTIVRANLASAVRRHRGARADATMVTVSVEDCSRYGAVRTDDDGWVTAFDEKAGVGAGYINAGVYVMQRDLMADFPCPSSLEREVLPTLVAGHRLLACPFDAPFIDIGTPESYAHLKARVHDYLPAQ